MFKYLTFFHFFVEIDFSSKNIFITTQMISFGLKNADKQIMYFETDAKNHGPRIKKIA